jgi:hypothetical protein
MVKGGSREAGRVQLSGAAHAATEEAAGNRLIVGIVVVPSAATSWPLDSSFFMAPPRPWLTVFIENDS